MTHLSVWEPVAVNKSHRPIMLPDEHSVYVKNGVGVYQGKSKIIAHQNGRVYLTNKRIICIDSDESTIPIGLSLSLVLSAELVEKFLRSSPKVKLFLKENLQREESVSTFTWTCMICSYNNTSPVGETTKCGSCGIRGPLGPSQSGNSVGDNSQSGNALSSSSVCPVCTFVNHPSMRSCEMCGSVLRQRSKPLAKPSGNPLNLLLAGEEEYTNGNPYIKLSFRKGGESLFYLQVQEQIAIVKWESLEQRGGVSAQGSRINKNVAETGPNSGAGILALHHQQQSTLKQNEAVLSDSLADIEQLMYKAHDLIAVTGSFAPILQTRTPGTNHVMMPLTVSRKSSLYLPELARHVSEYLLNHELLHKTSMVTLQDCFASYNRHLVYGCGLYTGIVTSEDFTKAVGLFDSLGLPVRTKRYRQVGLHVLTHKHVQSVEELHWSIFGYLEWAEKQFFREKNSTEIVDEFLLEKYRFFRGSTVLQVSSHFGWAPSVCQEEMEYCIQEGLIVFDRHILGTFYFVNKFDPRFGDVQI